MKRPRKNLSRASSLVAAAVALGLAGCGGGQPEGAADRVRLTVNVPCVLSAPIQGVVAAYESAHPGVAVTTEVDKPLGLLARAQAQPEGPAVVITMGDVEMGYLAEHGAVEASAVRTIAWNTYPLAVVAPAASEAELDDLTDLALPAVRRIYIEDPSQSSLGDRAERAMRSLGLWEAIEPKILRPDPNAMVLGEMLAGKADAAVVFEDCLFAEAGVEGSPPATVKVVGELPEEAYQAIPYQAAALRGAPQPEAARDFLDFLTSAEGREALRGAGLSPA